MNRKLIVLFVKKHTLYFIVVLLSMGTLYQCGVKEKETKSPRIRKLTRVLSPKYNATFSLNDNVNFKLTEVQDTVSIDSFVVTNDQIEVFNSNDKLLKTVAWKTGIANFRYTVFLSNGKKEYHSQRIIFNSDIAPEALSYLRVRTYTHDPDAYTQGLFYDNGFLYESTGRNGESTLRKVELATGKVLKKIDISSQYFGEGIATIGNKIFMLTYTSRRGFIYDKNTLEQINTFQYPTEGWGIASIGDSLVMSDGTENLYFLDPESLSETSRIQVYDQFRPIKELNELEYIDGKIYANIYQTEEIAIIDPKTGKLLGKINLKGIFDDSKYNKKLDVLNGIAHDPETDRTFVTGKWWPELYEIKILKTLNQ